VQNELAQLAAYTQRYPKEDPRRWAATLLMVRAQLAIGNLGLVQNLVRRVVEVSGGICPPAATNFAITMIDALLARSKFLRKDEIVWLQQIRSGFLRSETCGEVERRSSKSTRTYRLEEERVSSSELDSNSPSSTRPILILTEDVEPAVLEFIKAFEVGELWNSLTDHPELLSDLALEEMQRIMGYQIHGSAKRKLAERAALLRRCRSLGIDQVFRGYFGSGSGDDFRPLTADTEI